MVAPSAGSTQAYYDCATAPQEFRDFLDGSLTMKAAQLLRAHLNGCPACRVALAEFQQMYALMADTIGSQALDESFSQKAEERLKRTPEGVTLPASISTRMKPAREAEEFPDSGGEGGPGWGAQEEELAPAPAGMLGGWHERFGSAPWWIISTALHALLILLIGLVTMAVKDSQLDGEVVVTTELAMRPQEIMEEREPMKKSEALAALETKHETPATDPDSNLRSDIVVPPEILAKAELGDHFETINPDRPDTQSAFGNPDAHMFHSEQGSDDAAGGGGTGGLALDEVIGIGGNSGSPGSGGGWGGGHGTGIGVDKGSGRGSFGQRSGGGRKLMVMRHGGSKATESGVDRALEWLARHQEADGHWDAVKYEGMNDPRVQGINGNAAVTGFALLAFLGQGHTERVGKYKDKVKAGLEWMQAKLEEHEKTAGPGRYCSNHGSNYTQGVAALALAEAAGMCPNPRLKALAQRAMDGVVAGQIKDGPSEYQAWDYDPNGKTNDTSVTGWNVMALKSAKVAGLQITPASFEGAMRWINAGQDMAGVKPGDGEYFEGGLMTYRGTLAQPNGRKGMAVTAAASLTRLMVGGEKPEAPGVAGPCNLMKKPENLPTKWPGNLYFWYYATLCMFQRGGDHWKVWNEAMKPTLLNSQRKDGDFEGSWDPLFSYEGGHIYGGRVMSTALGCMCLEVYYRYLPIYR